MPHWLAGRHMTLMSTVIFFYPSTGRIALFCTNNHIDMQIEIFAIHKYLFSFQMFQEIEEHKQDRMILAHQIQKK